MGFEPAFTARIESRDGVASIALSGELDIATVPVLEDQLARLEGQGVVDVTLDLRDLTFLDYSALHSFLTARDRARTNGHRLTLVGASPPARRLFELTGKQFLLYEQEAINMLERFTGNALRPPA
jgi:anti-sigma B factor antagonist